MSSVCSASARNPPSRTATSWALCPPSVSVTTSITALLRVALLRLDVLLGGGLLLGAAGEHVLDERHDLLRAVGELEQLEVLRPELALLQRTALQPVDEPAPVVGSVQHDGEMLDLPGLDQRERFEQLVEGAEAARKDHEGLRVLHEHRLADEEVPEVDAEVDVVVQPLLVRELDVQADGESA